MENLFTDIVSTVGNLTQFGTDSFTSYVPKPRVHPLKGRSDLYEASDQSSDDVDIGRRLTKPDDYGRKRDDDDSGLGTTVCCDGSRKPNRKKIAFAKETRKKAQDEEAAKLAKELSELRADSTAFGIIELHFEYEENANTLKVTIKKIFGVRTELFDPEQFTHSSVQIRLAVMPSKTIRAKSALKSLVRPEFNETITLEKISSGDMEKSELRLRAYKCARHRRDQLIAEAVVTLKSIPFNEASSDAESDAEKESKQAELRVKLVTKLKPQNIDVQRVRKEAGKETQKDSKKKDAAKVANSEEKPKTMQAVAFDAISLANQSLQSEESSLVSGSTQSIRGAPELQLSLTYSALTGRLTVTILKCTKASAFSKIPPDVFVKVILLNANGEKTSESSTKVKAETNDPVFEESFIFAIPSFKLNDSTLMISAYDNKAKTKKKAVLGWMSMGAQNSSSDQALHWSEMKSHSGKAITRWHTLQLV